MACTCFDPTIDTVCVRVIVRTSCLYSPASPVLSRAESSPAAATAFHKTPQRQQPPNEPIARASSVLHTNADDAFAMTKRKYERLHKQQDGPRHRVVVYAPASARNADKRETKRAHDREASFDDNVRTCQHVKQKRPSNVVRVCVRNRRYDVTVSFSNRPSSETPQPTSQTLSSKSLVWFSPFLFVCVCLCLCLSLSLIPHRCIAFCCFPAKGFLI